MPDTAPAAVTYLGLPIGSGGAHSLGRMPLRIAYQRTMHFVETCTEQVGPTAQSFTVHDVPELPRQPDLEAELERRFGPGRQVAIPSDRVDDALDLLDELHPQPVNQWGMAPLWFVRQLKFRILDPQTGQVLPGQDPQHFAGTEYEWRIPLGTSGLRLMLDNTARLGIELCIPNADSQLLDRVVPWLQDQLPCKLSPKQWRSWTPTKSGSLKARKMAGPTL